MDRRFFLRSAGASILPLLSGIRPAFALDRRPAVKGAPRYVIRIHTMGGMDPVVMTDPKTRREVESWVDIPYESQKIADVGGVPLGPLFAPMKSWSTPLTFLNGVAVGVANHETGLLYASRFRRFATEQTPSLFDILGAHRDGQPLGSVSLNGAVAQQYTPTGHWFGTGSSWFGPHQKDLFAHLDASDPDDLRRMAVVLRAEAKQMAAASSAPGATIAALNDCAALFERLPSVPPFKLETWPGDDLRSQTLNLQRALWLLENDLTAGIFVNVGDKGIWDNHFDVTASQAEATGLLVPRLEKFLSELEKRRNSHGTLAENTLVVMASELGRFPRMNEMQGKDHFPETFYAFSGPWFPSGEGKWRVFGQTDTRMAAKPVDLGTGLAKSGGHVVTLDDVGCTMLHLAGLDPELFGYTGAVLPFLLRS